MIKKCKTQLLIQMTNFQKQQQHTAQCETICPKQENHNNIISISGCSHQKKHYISEELANVSLDDSLWWISLYSMFAWISHRYGFGE